MKNMKKWLKEAIEAYYYGKPRPEVYGSGKKEKLIKELQDKLEKHDIN